VSYTITRQDVVGRHLAVVRDRRSWSELGGQLIPLLDRVYAVVRAGRVRQSGHNVFLFREGTRDGVTVEVGVEVASPFDEVDGVSHSMTPPGSVASTLHVGAYAGLGQAHDAIANWCRQRGLGPASVWWEVYGDWHEDPGKVQTEVFHLLRS
jgi:hypothetical protein